MAEGRPQHDVGRLATHTGQLGQQVQILRHVAIIVFHQLLATRFDILGLVAKEAGALDRLLQFCRGQRGQIGGGGVLLEQLAA